MPATEHDPPRPETLREVVRSTERAAAENVPLPVAQAIAEHYRPGEQARLYAALEAVHRERLAALVYRHCRRDGLTAEEAIRETAIEVGRSDAWVDQLVYPRAKLPPEAP